MTQPPPAATKPAFKDRLKLLVEEYGRVGIIVYVVLCVLYFAGAFVALQLGLSPESTVGKAGMFMATYGLYKVGMPLRIAAALVITPIVAKLIQRFARAKIPPAA